MIVEGFTLGLSTGAFCLGYCFPILGPLLLSRQGGSLRDGARALGLFLIGRFVAYMLVGFLVGLAGLHTRQLAFLQGRIIPSVFIALGTVMAVYGVFTCVPHLRLCGISAQSFRRNRHLLIVGFFAGVNICPPFVLALSYAVGFGGIMKSIGFFLFFFMATSLYLLPFIFSGLLGRYEIIRKIARIVSVGVGCWFVYLGITNIRGGV